jgi:hypothetical protein
VPRELAIWWISLKQNAAMKGLKLESSDLHLPPCEYDANGNMPACQVGFIGSIPFIRTLLHGSFNKMEIKMKKFIYGMVALAGLAFVPMVNAQYGYGYVAPAPQVYTVQPYVIQPVAPVSYFYLQPQVVYQRPLFQWLQPRPQVNIYHHHHSHNHYYVQPQQVQLPPIPQPPVYQEPDCYYQ